MLFANLYIKVTKLLLWTLRIGRVHYYIVLLIKQEETRKSVHLKDSAQSEEKLQMCYTTVVVNNLQHLFNSRNAKICKEKECVSGIRDSFKYRVHKLATDNIINCSLALGMQ